MGGRRDALAGALRAVRHEFVLVAGFSVFINLLLLTAPLYMLQVFDRVLASRSVETLVALTLAAALALVVYGALEGVRGRMLARLAGWLDGALAPELLRASAALARAGRAEQGVRGLRELGEIRSFLGGNGVNALFDAPCLPLFVAVIWLLHPWLGALALGGAAVLFALALANELAARGPVRAAMASGALDQERAEAVVRNADVARAMGMDAALMAGW
ncbi:MAG: type I secretion system permease/ATPase, partial [Geminicoccaceae bacterium]